MIKEYDNWPGCFFLDGEVFGMIRVVITFVVAALLSVASVIGSAVAKNWNTGNGKQTTTHLLEKFTTDKAIVGDTKQIKIIQKQLGFNTFACLHMGPLNNKKPSMTKTSLNVPQCN